MTIPDDDPLLEQLAAELSQMGPMDMRFRPETVLQLVGLLQLALRHPGVAATPASSATAASFLTAATQYFARCPATLAIIKRGDDPAHDRPWR